MQIPLFVAASGWWPAWVPFSAVFRAIMTTSLLVIVFCRSQAQLVSFIPSRTLAELRRPNSEISLTRVARSEWFPSLGGRGERSRSPSVRFQGSDRDRLTFVFAETIQNEFDSSTFQFESQP